MFQKRTRRNHARSAPSRGKMLEVSGHQILRRSCLGTLQKHVVIGIGTNIQRVSWSHPQSLFADCPQSLRDDFGIALEPWSSDHFLIFRKYVAAEAELNGAVE